MDNEGLLAVLNDVARGLEINLTNTEQNSLSKIKNRLRDHLSMILPL